MRKGNRETGKRLQEYLKANKLTQKAFAESIGSKPSSLANIIGGWSMVGRALAVKIESKTGIPVSAWDGVAEPSPETKVKFPEIYAVKKDGRDCRACCYTNAPFNCRPTLKDLTGIDCLERGVIFKKHPTWIPCPIDIPKGSPVKCKSSGAICTVVVPPITEKCAFHGAMVVKLPGGLEKLCAVTNYQIEAA